MLVGSSISSGQSRDVCVQGVHGAKGMDGGEGAPADVFLPDRLLADRAVQDAVEGLQEVVVGIDLVQVDWD